MNFNLVATTPMGIEAIVAKEVQELGYETKVENGRVFYSGDKRAIVRSNLWLRCADRVKIVVAQFPAYTFEELFEKTKEIEWDKYLPVDAKFPVDGRSHKSTLFSVSDCQSIVKKAIVEKMKKSYGVTGWLTETGARYRLEIIMLNDIATILLDTSGDGLHKRGYRAKQGTAPLKETLAAAMVKLTNWKGETPLYDLFCGSGTLLIEAAMAAQNMAPGIPGAIFCAAIAASINNVPDPQNKSYNGVSPFQFVSLTIAAANVSFNGAVPCLARYPRL